MLCSNAWLIVFFIFLSYSATFAENVPKYTKTMKLPVLILAFLALFCQGAVPAFAQPPAAAYFLHPRHADDIPLSRYAERRKTVLATMSAKSLAIFFAADARNRQNDVDYEYRQSSDFWYLCGFPEAESTLMLIPGGIVLPKMLDSTGTRHEALLFVKKRDLYLEMRSGSITGADRAKAMYGVMALENVNFASVLGMLLQPEDSTFRRDTVFATTFPTSAVTEPLSGEVVNIERESRLRLQKQYPRAVIRSQKRLLADMRQIKDADELRLLRKAIDITLSGHREAIAQVKPKAFEYEIEAAMEGTFKRLGAEDVGYASIVGAGANSCILHYTLSRREAEAGEVLLMDCGAEYHGYTADITRTVPVNGKFSPEQREIYTLVYNAQEAAIKEYRKGVDWRLPHSRAVEIIRSGLLKLGIITNPDDYKLYFPHGSVHYIGLDVHDAGNYSTFQPNMIFTCEPGIYIPAGSACDKKWWDIGVRIEDDVLVTDGEPVIVSAALPRTADGIEAMMKPPTLQTPARQIPKSSTKKR